MDGGKAALPRPGNDREKQFLAVLSSRTLPIGIRRCCMSGLRARVLGDFEARVGDALTLSLPARKRRALLAYLAVTGQRAERRERLAALLWGEVPEEQSRQSLRKALWHLREALAGGEPPPLSTTSETIALVTETVDILQFEALVRDGRPDALRDAMALYRGDLLEGFRIN